MVGRRERQRKRWRSESVAGRADAHQACGNHEPIDPWRHSHLCSTFSVLAGVREARLPCLPHGNGCGCASGGVRPLHGLNQRTRGLSSAAGAASAVRPPPHI
eukprot:351800-Chlamydomonas_euryale.AAC.2